MSAQDLLDRAAAKTMTPEHGAYVQAVRRSRRTPLTEHGERLLQGEQAAFALMIDSVHDEEDFGDAFTFAD